MGRNWSMRNSDGASPAQGLTRATWSRATDILRCAPGSLLGQGVSKVGPGASFR